MNEALFPAQGQEQLELAEDTQELGFKLGKALEPGDVVILDGPLGAGKTTFTQGVARGMDVKGRVTSPTFVIAREHRNMGDGPNLIHVDAYRLLGDGDAQETDPIDALESLDLETELDQAVVLAEWGGGLVERITDRYLLISFDRETAVVQDPDSEARIISWRWVGQES